MHLRPIGMLFWLTALSQFVACVGSSAGKTDPSVGGENGAGGQAGTPVEGGTGGAATPELPSPDTCAAIAVPTVGTGELRRLSQSQYRNAVRELLGLEMDPLIRFLPDGKTGPFDANSIVAATELDVEKYQDAARDLAARVAIAKIRPCTPANASDAACRDRFIESFGMRVYRRPLTVDETAGYRVVFGVGAADGFDSGVRLVVESMLQSPNFIYLPEFGTNSAQDTVSNLDPFELATRLSFLLWDSVPDDQLLAAARDGKLQDDADLKAQVERMVAAPAFGQTARAFGRQWTTIDKIGEVGKDPLRYRFWSAEFAAATVLETEKFFEQVLLRGDGRLATLLLADYTYLDPEQTVPLTIYGLNRSAVAADGRAPLDARRRSGFLTQLSVLSRTSTNERSSAINRGILVQESFLCQHLPSPPDNVDFSLPANADKLSPQELLREHQKNPTCKPCHGLIDPIGFTFSRYDGAGQYREQINGVPLDESGSVPGSDVDRSVNGARELSQALSESEKVKECLATHWFRFALGRDPTEDDLCTLAQVKQAGIDSDGDFRAMLLAMARSASFRMTKGESR
jgi:Protein of unknown function (DUF1592)/Protein of unknown function (DUF1588)/Protein of unknown function (DUF1585)/Protein of unknown function (DUF1595)/Protein of unknown function (DUF1587)